jgi:hypothetical protein
VFVATTRNMVYAFDAEDSEACHPFWRVNLDEPGATPVPRSDYGSGYTDFTGEIGVTSTPVIDRAAGTIYLTSKSKKKGPDGNPHYRYRLHALDLLTGSDKLGGPSVMAETIVNDPQHGGDARPSLLSPGQRLGGPAREISAVRLPSMPSCNCSDRDCYCKTTQSTRPSHRTATSVHIMAGCWPLMPVTSV